MRNSAVKHVVQRLADEREAHNQTKLALAIANDLLTKKREKENEALKAVSAIKETMTKAEILERVQKLEKLIAQLQLVGWVEDNPNPDVPSDIPF